jgi:hypothetical protein
MKSAFPQPEIIFRRGEPVSVVLAWEHYLELLERVEDVADLSWLQRTRRKSRRYRPLKEYLAASRGLSC